MRRKKRRISVTYSGLSHVLVRWSPNRRQLAKFSNIPTIIEDDGTVQCKGCNRIYDATPSTVVCPKCDTIYPERPRGGVCPNVNCGKAKVSPPTCVQDVLEILKLVDSQGRPQEPRFGYKKQHVWHKCGSTRFIDNLWINELKQVAAGNPGDWKIEEA